MADNIHWYLNSECPGGLRVEMKQNHSQPVTCRVFRDRRLIFSGRSDLNLLAVETNLLAVETKLDRVRHVLPQCESFVPPHDCATSGRDINSPYGADGYCLPCKIRAVLDPREEHVDG